MPALLPPEIVIDPCLSPGNTGIETCYNCRHKSLPIMLGSDLFVAIVFDSKLFFWILIRRTLILLSEMKRMIIYVAKRY